MANTLLTATAITRAALAILHQKLTFIGNINRAYDSSFAESGAKIGDSLRIRLPNQYTVRSGATLSAQDTNERSVTLQVASQKGVDVNFTSAEMTLSLDDFSERILEPAMAVLAANIENDALSMTRDVYQQVGTYGTTPATLKLYLDSRTELNKGLAPKDRRRAVHVPSEFSASIVDALKGLFQDSDEISKQYREGMMGRTAMYDWYENEMAYRLAHGDNTFSSITVNTTVSTEGASSIVLTGLGNTKTVKAGTVFTAAAVYAVNPETKVSTGALQKFVVTADATSNSSGVATLSISPSIYTTGALKNVDAFPQSSAAVAFPGSPTASTTYPIGLAHHRDAFTFATADLVMPKGVDFAAREMMDGISMRTVRQYDINNDKLPCRIDVLYGYKTLRPEWACRIVG